MRRRDFGHDKTSIYGGFFSVSTSEILDELPKLSRQEQDAIRLKLADLDGDGWADTDVPLSAVEKALIRTRVHDHERDPASAILCEQFEEGLKRRLGE